MSQSDYPPAITCREVHQKIRAGEPLFLLDCRELDERQTAAIQGSLLIPMRDLPARVTELEPYRDREVVVFCHLGGRSARVAAWLREQGFIARTMEGGIDQWTVEIDPSLQRY